MRTSRQVMRLESVSRSPIFSHFQETLAGTSTIRAYQQEERFVEENERRVDFNQIAYYPYMAGNRLGVNHRFLILGLDSAHVVACFQVAGSSTGVYWKLYCVVCCSVCCHRKKLSLWRSRGLVFVVCVTGDWCLVVSTLMYTVWITKRFVFDTISAQKI